MPNFQLTHVDRIGANQYASVYAGYLESMFAGAGAEWLYRPFAGKSAIGVDANRVQQRNFRQDFGFDDAGSQTGYRVTTGHATLYWDTGWNDVLATLSAGRYLAGDSGVTVGLSRVFRNGVAHASGLIGEDPGGVPNNLFPYIGRVAVGRLAELPVFGNDYPTPDGTGVRDYIHVVDLAAGHVAALRAIDRLPAVTAINLGTGRGFSVLEAVAAFERASGRKVPFRILARRPGDVATSCADATLAGRLLGWKAGRDLDAMCRDAWRWQEWRAAHEAQL